MTPSRQVQPRVLQIQSAALPSLLGKAALEPIQIKGQESLSELYRYDILLSTPDNPGISQSQSANIPIKHLLGKEASISIELDNQQKRHISGHVTQAQYIKSQDRRSIYQITLEPWLHLATRTTHFKIFQHQSVLDIIQNILSDYPFPVENQCSGWGISTPQTPASSYPLLDYQVQYGESDYNFINRLMRQWGIYYYFKHSASGHSLILIDDAGSHQPNNGSAYQTIPYYPEGHKAQQEYIHHFQSQEQHTSGHMTGNNYDFRSPKASLEQTSDMPRNTGQAHQTIQAWAGVNLAASPNPNATAQEQQEETARLRHHTHIHMQSLGILGATSQGQGHLRGITTGHTFRLINHPQQNANRDYLITSSQLEITNNPSASGEETYQIHSQFSVIPADHSYRAPIALDSHGRIQKPRTSGPQSAHVTGPANQDLWTDPHGRIKISFPWNRHCPKDETSSCWVRIASPASGGEQGHIHIPRIGQEVLVDFEHGDPDRPIIIGILNNSQNKPNWQLPAQAALGGIRSRELSASGEGNAPIGRSNHLIFDDTAGKIQVQLKSDHQHSQLSLGHITRIEDNSGRKDYRGQGFELRTDGHGAIRAKDGLHITTEAKSQAQGHILSSGETQRRLQTAQQQHQAGSELAQSHKAHQNAQDQSEVTQAIETQNQEITGNANNQFPELTAPHIVLSSPAGIASTTPKTTHQHSDEHHAITSGSHTSISAGKSLLASVKEAIRLFAYQAGIKLLAASGKVELEAQSGEIVLLAREDLKISSTKGELHLTSPKRIIFNGGGSFMQWDAKGITQGTTGTYVEHAAKVHMTAAKQMGVNVKGMPHVDVYDEQFQFTLPSGSPLKIFSYVLGTEKEAHLAQTNTLGRISSVNTKETQKIKTQLACVAIEK